MVVIGAAIDSAVGRVVNAFDGAVVVMVLTVVLFIVMDGLDGFLSLLRISR